LGTQAGSKVVMNLAFPSRSTTLPLWALGTHHHQ
jgi:hypothetical protein